MACPNDWDNIPFDETNRPPLSVKQALPNTDLELRRTDLPQNHRTAILACLHLYANFSLKMRELSVISDIGAEVCG